MDLVKLEKANGRKLTRVGTFCAWVLTTRVQFLAMPLRAV